MFSETNTIGGALWLNFLNTKRYSDGVVVDLLQNAEFFKKWLSDNGLKEDVAAAADGKKLRTLRGLLKDAADTEDSFTKLNNWLANIPVKLSFSAQDGRIETHIQAFEKEDELLAQIIESFSETCRTYGLERVRQCDHESCLLNFLDTSKGSRRRWCDMGTCGNRNKASKHYQKKVKDV